jgi:hypothetical protein
MIYVRYESRKRDCLMITAPVPPAAQLRRRSRFLAAGITTNNKKPKNIVHTVIKLAKNTSFYYIAHKLFTCRGVNLIDLQNNGNRSTSFVSLYIIG